MSQPWHFAFLFFTCFFFFIDSAAACEPPDHERKVHFPQYSPEDSIFVGRLVDYEVSQPPYHGWARLTYDVDEVLKGEFGNRVQLSWTGDYGLGVLTTEYFGHENEIVAVMPLGSQAPYPDTAFDNYWPDGKALPPTFVSELRTLARFPCSDFGSVPATTRNIQIVKSWIATGRRVPAADVERADLELMSLDSRSYEEPRSIFIRMGERLETIPGFANLSLGHWLLVSLLGLAFLCTGIFAWGKRRRKPKA